VNGRRGGFRLHWSERLVLAASSLWAVGAGFAGGIHYLDDRGVEASFTGFVLHWALAAAYRLVIASALLCCVDMGVRLGWRLAVRARLEARARRPPAQSPAGHGS
jgi:hypothetical protein